MTVRLIIVDDHPVVRQGLRGMLATDPTLDMVGEAATGEYAPVQIAELKPDVVLMDLRMPGMDGATATGRITREHPGVKVVVLTTHDSDTDILRAVEARAAGYLLKDTPMEDLAAALRAAARGETVLAPPVAARLVSRMRTPPAEALTPREVQVLAEVARGLTNADVGRALYIGETTVKTTCCGSSPSSASTTVRPPSRWPCSAASCPPPAADPPLSRRSWRMPCTPRTYRTGTGGKRHDL